MEFKDWTDWKKWSDDVIRKQFVNDLANPEFSELGKLKWVFRKTNIDETNLKKNIMKALRKADGSPVDELTNITTQKVRLLFPKESKFINKSNRINFLLEKLEDKNIFFQIFEIVN